MASNPVVPNTFVAETPAYAAEVNENFQLFATWIAANAMQIDGSVAFTNIPSGPAGADPVSADQFTRKAYVDSVASGGAPAADIGDIKMGGWAVAPSGWLLCQGQLVSRTTYSALFAVVGTTFGAGDGATTFGVPDLRGRSPLGAGTGTGLTARTLGASLGTETHLLTGAQSGTSVHNHTQTSHTHTQDAHTHTQDAHSHSTTPHNHTQDAHTHSITQTYGAYGNSGGVRNTITSSGDTGLAVSAAAPTINTSGVTVSNATATNQSTTATNQSTTATNVATVAADAAEAHPNMQPSVVVNFAIKY